MMGKVFIKWYLIVIWIFFEVLIEIYLLWDFFFFLSENLDKMINKSSCDKERYVCVYFDWFIVIGG